MSKPRFCKVTVATLEGPPEGMNTFSTVGDVNGDGRPDIVVSARNGRMVWIENTGERGPWPVHLIDEVRHMECGGSVCDLTGNGLGDVINGGDYQRDEIWWWENPGDDAGRWARRIIAKTGDNQVHDTLVGRVGEGPRSLFFTNQHGGTTVYRVPLPDDPRVSPWPALEVVADGCTVPWPGDPSRELGEEGLAIGDVDGDGVEELVCGTCWYKLVNGEWRRHRYAPKTYVSTRVAVADVDGDGQREIVLSEGDPLIYGKPQGGRLAWFKAGSDPAQPWTEHVLADGLMDAHSLQVGDLCGNGWADIMVGEIGKAQDRRYVCPPRVMVFENLGGNRFHNHVIDRGTGTHDALLVDMDGDGLLDIVGKPLHGDEKQNVHIWFNSGPQ